MAKSRSMSIPADEYPGEKLAIREVINNITHYRLFGFITLIHIPADRYPVGVKEQS